MNTKYPVFAYWFKYSYPKFLLQKRNSVVKQFEIMLKLIKWPAFFKHDRRYKTSPI